MNTLEARIQMRDLAARALVAVTRLAAGSSATYDDARLLRELATEARTLLAEAGFPAEAVWRGLQRADMGMQTSLSGADTGYWRDIADELGSGVETLDNVVGPQARRDTDVHIVG